MVELLVVLAVIFVVSRMMAYTKDIRDSNKEIQLAMQEQNFKEQLILEANRKTECQACNSQDTYDLPPLIDDREVLYRARLDQEIRNITR